MTKLELNSLAVDCIIGERPEERIRNQRLLVDVSLDVDDTPCMTDRLADAVDYAALGDRIRSALVAAECRMIERAAKVALETCLADVKVRHARVKVTKTGSVPGLGSASATVEGGALSGFPEYETAGIETIARGICIRDGKLLLCRAKGGASTYLPGGHIEFGETGRDALAREMSEEAGLDVAAGRFRGGVENAFIQHGKPHAEINLVYDMALPEGADVVAQEDWIEFVWWPIEDLDSANLLPAAFRSLKDDPDAMFST